MYIFSERSRADKGRNKIEKTLKKREKLIFLEQRVVDFCSCL